MRWGARQDEVIGEPDVDRYVARAIELNTAAGLATQRELARVRELHGFPCGLRSVYQPILRLFSAAVGRDTWLISQRPGWYFEIVAVTLFGIVYEIATPEGSSALM